MGHILDMVPNHMGVLGADNAWWLDVLENGPASAYADFFDIEWQPANPALHGKVLIPVLGDQYGLVLERGELKLEFDASAGEFSVCYYDHRFPIDPREYPRVLEARVGRAARRPSVPAEHAAPSSRACAALSAICPRARMPRRNGALERSATRRCTSASSRGSLPRTPRSHGPSGRRCRHFNGTSRETERASSACTRCSSGRRIGLSSWRVAADEINYRRFFDINDLAALRMENERVFEATHRFVLELARERQDRRPAHRSPDGLYDPEQYFRRVQQRYAQLAGIDARAGRTDGRRGRCIVVIEKIAAGHERLPETWAVHGTSGYRFATAVNGVLVDHDGGGRDGARVSRLRDGRAGLTPRPSTTARRAIMRSRARLAARRCSRRSSLRIARADRRTRDYTLNNLRHALAEVVACFPVYRTYIVDTPSAQDRRYIDWAVAQARRRSRCADTTIFEFVRSVLLDEAAAGREPPS